ncbi:MAG: hypothetical protein CR986_07345 [Ignavibacteriae bacterium]|nr:MAG: hypothetical protein CR986_07345 [Ignavibacteriota bacterium]
MKQALIVFLIIGLLFVGCNTHKNTTNIELKTNKDSVSYSLGNEYGKNFKLQKIEVNSMAFAMGMKDAYADTSMFSEELKTQILNAYQMEMRKKMEEANKETAEKNKAEAEKFFKENKEKEGVITLDNGIQYKVLKKGSGKSPTLSSTVKAHYTGKLLDGTVFDSSVKRGTPFETKLTGVIKGWTEILQLMKEGDKWEVYIPSELAYGSRGAGGQIGPNAALIFELELLSVN